jgi:hypothetical protein
MDSASGALTTLRIHSSVILARSGRERIAWNYAMLFKGFDSP